MQQPQSFSIAQSGVVRGGDAQYTADLITGAVSYSAEVLLPLWKKKQASGIYQADPNDFLSKALPAIGSRIKIGPVTFLATRVVLGETDVNITIDGSSITGTGVLDTTGQYFKIKSLEAVGKMFGLSFDLLLTQE